MVELLALSNSLEFKQMTQEGLSLVAFGTSWSSPCRVQYKTLINFTRKYRGILAIASVDVEKHQGIAQKCNIQSVPTLIMYRKNKEIKRTVGIQSIETLYEFIQT